MSSPAPSSPASPVVVPLPFPLSSVQPMDESVAAASSPHFEESQDQNMTGDYTIADYEAATGQPFDPRDNTDEDYTTEAESDITVDQQPGEGTNRFRQVGLGLFLSILALLDGQVTPETDLTRPEVPQRWLHEELVNVLFDPANLRVLDFIARNDRARALQNLLWDCSHDYHTMVIFNTKAVFEGGHTFAQLCCIHNAHNCLVVLNSHNLLAFSETAARPTPLAPDCKNSLLYLAVRHRAMEAFAFLVLVAGHTLRVDDWVLRLALYHSSDPYFEQLIMKESPCSPMYAMCNLIGTTAGVTPFSTNNGGWAFAEAQDQAHRLQVFPHWNMGDKFLDSTLREIWYLASFADTEHAQELLGHFRTLSTLFGCQSNYHLSSAVPYFDNRTLLAFLFSSPVFPALMEVAGQEFVDLCLRDREPLHLFMHFDRDFQRLKLLHTWPVLRQLLAGPDCWFPSLTLQPMLEVSWDCATEHLQRLWEDVEAGSKQLPELLSLLLSEVSPLSYVTFLGLRPGRFPSKLVLSWSRSDIQCL